MYIDENKLAEMINDFVVGAFVSAKGVERGLQEGKLPTVVTLEKLRERIVDNVLFGHCEQAEV